MQSLRQIIDSVSCSSHSRKQCAKLPTAALRELALATTVEWKDASNAFARNHFRTFVSSQQIEAVVMTAVATGRMTIGRATATTMVAQSWQQQRQGQQ